MKLNEIKGAEFRTTMIHMVRDLKKVSKDWDKNLLSRSSHNSNSYENGYEDGVSIVVDQIDRIVKKYQRSL